LSIRSSGWHWATVALFSRDLRRRQLRQPRQLPFNWRNRRCRRLNQHLHLPEMRRRVTLGLCRLSLLSLLLVRAPWSSGVHHGDARQEPEHVIGNWDGQVCLSMRAFWERWAVSCGLTYSCTSSPSFPCWRRGRLRERFLGPLGLTLPVWGHRDAQFPSPARENGACCKGERASARSKHFSLLNNSMSVGKGTTGSPDACTRNKGGTQMMTFRHGWAEAASSSTRAARLTLPSLIWVRRAARLPRRWRVVRLYADCMTSSNSTAKTHHSGAKSVSCSINRSPCPLHRCNDMFAGDSLIALLLITQRFTPRVTHAPGSKGVARSEGTMPLLQGEMWTFTWLWTILPILAYTRRYADTLRVCRSLAVHSEPDAASCACTGSATGTGADPAPAAGVCGA